MYTIHSKNPCPKCGGHEWKLYNINNIEITDIEGMVPLIDITSGFVLSLTLMIHDICANCGMEIRL